MIDYAQLSRRQQIRRLRGLALQALSLYDIEPASLSLLSHYFNTTFAVTARDGTRYVLRIQRPGEDPGGATRRHSSIASELWWVERLRAELGLPVPDVARTPCGEDMVQVPIEGGADMQPCVLFRWMDGRFLERGLAPVHLRQVGRLTARLHNDSERLSLPPWFDRPRVDRADAETDESAVRLFAKRWSPEAAQLVSSTFAQIRQVQDELGSSRDVFGLIHADIHEKNYLFRDGTMHLIDFDDCGWGHYLYDFAVTLNQVAWLPQAPALRRALLAGYRELRDLSPTHESMIDTLIMLRNLQDLTWFLEKGDASDFSDWMDRVANGIRTLERYHGSI